MENSEPTPATGETQATPIGTDMPLEVATEHPEMQLEEAPPAIREAVERAGWPSLMPVQARVLPLFLEGQDVMVQSRTGSGKTGAFLLPLAGRLSVESMACQALILTPTRELANQVAKVAEELFGADGLRVAAVYGGVGYKQQLDAFKAGAHVVVGTPGRVLDHLLQRNFTLDHLEALVFDEADRMLSMGFLPDMQQLKRFLPKRHVNTAMFSATYPAHVLRLAGMFLTDPTRVSLSTDAVHVTNTDHQYYEVPQMEKDRALVRILEAENPASAIIFCNTKNHVSYLATVLTRFGFDAEQLSSDLSQSARERVLQRVRDGNLRFLVATDVAARGIDIPELSHVFQYEVPEDHENYIHRAGRTGRAGASGVAATLAGGLELMELKRIGKRYKIDFEVRTPPSENDVATLLTERVTAYLEAEYRKRDNVQRERLARFLPLVRSLIESEDESMLLAMLLDDVDMRQRAADLFHLEADTRASGTRNSAPKRDDAEAKSGGSRSGKRRRRR